MHASPGPLIVFALGSYCLDSKNSFCFFPGTPFYHRVIRCSLTNKESESDVSFPTTSQPQSVHESRKEDLHCIRQWAMRHNPPESMSSHWWYRDLDGDAKAAFDRCAEASQITTMFRSLFSTRHYCLDVVEGMNEIYISGGWCAFACVPFSSPFRPFSWGRQALRDKTRRLTLTTSSIVDTWMAPSLSFLSCPCIAASSVWVSSSSSSSPSSPLPPSLS